MVIRNLKARLKVFGVLAAAALVSVLLTLGVRQFVNEALSPDSDILGNYLQVIGAIYAFVIAFVIFVVWSQYTKTEAVIDQEVGKLRDLWMMCGAYQDCQTCAALQERIAAYATAVADEVDSGGQGRRSLGLATDEWQRLERTVRSFRAVEPRELVVYGDILRELCALSDIRGERLTIARTRIPWVLWDLILFVTAITLLPFYFLPVRNVVVEIVMVSSMSSSLTFILMLIRDLDDPFRGVFNVSFAPFRQVANDRR